MNLKLYNKHILIYAVLLVFISIVTLGCQNSNDTRVIELESQLAEAEQQIDSLKSKVSEEENTEEQTDKDAKIVELEGEIESLKLELSAKETVTEQTNVNNKDCFPYAVPVSEINNTTFYFSGVNNPVSVTLSFQDNHQGTVEFINDTSTSEQAEGQKIFGASIQNIETKEIRIFNKESTSEADQIRTVKVNTEIVLQNNDDLYLQGNLYAIYNKQGAISLITPNYAGNVSPELSDVRQELAETKE